MSWQNGKRYRHNNTEGDVLRAWQVMSWQDGWWRYTNTSSPGDTTVFSPLSRRSCSVCGGVAWFLPSVEVWFKYHGKISVHIIWLGAKMKLQYACSRVASKLECLHTHTQASWNINFSLHDMHIVYISHVHVAAATHTLHVVVMYVCLMWR